MNLIARLLAAVVACACVLPSVAQAQASSDRTARLVVGYAPGGATDLIARFLATELQKRWGATVVPENKPGAGGMLGAQQVARAAPDGRTLLVAYTPEIAINKFVFKRMPYDPVADLEPIALVATAPLILASGPKLKQTNWAAVMREAAGKPLSYGSAGVGGQQHLGGELLRLLTRLDLQHVPFKGTGPAVTDLIGGQIDLVFATAPPLMQHVKSGRLTALFVAGPKRQAEFPDVPTAAEVGLPSLDLPTWFGVLGPKGMDPRQVERIAQDIGAILADPAVSKPLLDLGLTLAFLPTGRFKAFIDDELRKYADLVAKAGVEPQ